MQMVGNLADRIHVLEYGRTIADGEPEAALKDPEVSELASIDDLVRRIPGCRRRWRQRRRGIDGGCGGTEEDGCCARAIVAAKQTTTMAARCQVESKTGVEAFTQRICEPRVLRLHHVALCRPN